MEIIRNSRGYYTLVVNGTEHCNCDTPRECREEYERDFGSVLLGEISKYRKENANESGI